MSERVYELLEYPPLFMFAFGFWALGNRQIFFNKPGYYDTIGSEANFRSDHSLIGSGEDPWFLVPVKDNGMVPSLLCLLFLILTCLYVFSSKVIIRCFDRCQEKVQEEEVEDENLGDYYNCLKEEDRLRLLAFEMAFRKKMHLWGDTDENLVKLASSQELKQAKSDKTKMHKKMINEINFDILSNSRYRKKLGCLMIPCVEDFSNDVIQVLNLDRDDYHYKKDITLEQHKKNMKMNTFAAADQMTSPSVSNNIIIF